MEPIHRRVAQRTTSFLLKNKLEFLGEFAVLSSESSLV